MKSFSIFTISFTILIFFMVSCSSKPNQKREQEKDYIICLQKDINSSDEKIDREVN